jgi:predicted MFS family arabinose efflux permease
LVEVSGETSAMSIATPKVVRGNDSSAGRWVTVTVIVLSTFVAQSFARFTFGLLLPAMKADLGISYGLAGWLGTINLAGYLISTVVTSAASLRFPPHRLVQFGLGLATCGITILATTRSTPLLLVGMVIGGLGGAAAWIPAPIVAASAFPPERRGFAMGLCSMAIGAGIVLATLFATAVRKIGHNAGLWRPIWLGEAAVGLLVTVLSIVVLKPVPVTPGSPPKLSVLRTVPSWWAPTISYACFGLGYVLFSTFVVAALEKDAGFGKGHAVWVYALMGTGIATGSMVLGRLSDGLGRRAAMIGSFTSACFGCLAVLIGIEPIVSLATLAFGVGMAGAIVSIASYLGDHVRPQEFSAAFGVVTAGFGVAQMIGPRLGGWMIDRAGTFRWVFVVAACVWAVGAIVAATLPRIGRLHPRRH